MLNRLLPLLLLTLLNTATLSAQDVEARFTMEKTNYLAGEPIFVVLTVSNKGKEPVWLDFKSPDLPKLLCNDFAVEVPGGESALEQWGCGLAGSCVRGFKELSPGKSISLRQLLNQQFRLQPGAYTIRAHTTVVVHGQDLLDSPQVAQFDVSDRLTLKVQRSSENQLRAVFQPIVAELDSPDPLRQGEAAGAIMALAAPFLEDALIGLARTTYAFGAMTALRKASTLKTRNALAQIAISNDDSILRNEAIRNLGRTGDMTYLPVLLRLMRSDDKQILNAAAEAAGNLGGADVVQQLAALISSPDEQTRVAGANGLGNTHARQAVPILLELLLDSDSNVRQAAIGGLSLLTHHAALDGNQWADISTTESAAAVHQRWVRWWDSHATTTEIHSMSDCASPQPLE